MENKIKCKKQLRKLLTILGNPIMKWGLFPIALLLFWFIFSMIRVLSSDISFSVLTYGYGDKHIVSPQTKELLHGTRIIGQFTALENNMGIISIRFNTFGRINNDTIIFRMKEKGAEKWYYEYKFSGVNQFVNNGLFPFGFPIVKDSKGKTYIFELESLKGQQGNAITLSNVSPVFTVKYQFDRQELLANKIALLKFSLKKVIVSFSNINVMFPSLIYISPLILYLLYQFNRRSIVEGVYPELFLLVLIVVDIITLNTYLDSVTCVLSILWIVIIFLKKYKSTRTILFFLILLGLCPPLLLLKQEGIVAGIGVWLGMFLLIGVIHSIAEYSGNPWRIVKIFTEEIRRAYEEI